MTDIEFQPFKKVPRLFREVTITEKIDGTNGCVYVPEDLSVVRAGSRNRWVKVGDDNYGFAGWVAEHEEELRDLGPGFHYGEWWGYKIARNYGLSERRFSLFNTHRWGASRPACCHVVPILYQGSFETDMVQDCIDSLSRYGSVAVPGFMQPEGVMTFHTASNSIFKTTILNDEKHKGE